MGEARQRALAGTMNSRPEPQRPDNEKIMSAMLHTLRQNFPGKHFALFVFDTGLPAVSILNSKYDYAATCENAELVAVLRSHVAKNAILDVEPEGETQ